MPNILFASNSVSHFPGSVIGSPAWSYDPNRVPYSIKSELLTPLGSPEILPNAEATDEWWFHFRVGSDYWDVNTEEPIIEINDINGARIFRLALHNRSEQGYFGRLVADGTEYAEKRFVPVAPDQMRTFDVKLAFTALNAKADVYMNEILLMDMSYPVTSWNPPTHFLLGGAKGSFNASEGDQYFSEIIVADGDTRNARLDLLRAQAVGQYGNWNGGVATLSDEDPTTGMTTTLPDQFQSTLLTPYTGANNVSNVVQMTTSVRGINSPTKMEHLIRMSGVDYVTSQFNVPFTKDYQITDWTLNPATSAPWEGTDLDAAEFGFKSIA